MPSRESITATIDLDDLELPQRPTSGWNPADEAGRVLIEQAVRTAFSPLGGAQQVLVQHDRVVVTLKAGREPVTGAQLLDKALRQAGAGKIGAAIDTLQRAVRADPAWPDERGRLDRPKGLGRPARKLPRDPLHFGDQREKGVRIRRHPGVAPDKLLCRLGRGASQERRTPSVIVPE